MTIIGGSPQTSPRMDAEGRSQHYRPYARPGLSPLAAAVRFINSGWQGHHAHLTECPVRGSCSEVPCGFYIHAGAVLLWFLIIDQNIS